MPPYAIFQDQTIPIIELAIERLQEKQNNCCCAAITCAVRQLRKPPRFEEFHYSERIKNDFENFLKVRPDLGYSLRYYPYWFPLCNLEIRLRALSEYASFLSSTPS